MRHTIIRSSLAAAALLLAVAAPASGTKNRAAGVTPLGPSIADDVTPRAVPTAPASSKLASALAQIARIDRVAGGGAALDAAHARRVAQQGKLLRIVLERRGNANLRSAFAAAGGRVEGTWRNLVQALVPPSALESLAARNDVVFVRQPLASEYDVAGEEVPASNALASHQLGWFGAGAKVAIIDAGFAGYASKQAIGELPPQVRTADFCGGRLTQASEHGTAVAEIVYEMAPAAQLYLICYAGDVGFQQAEAYAKAQGAQIITHSGSFFNAGRGDGVSGIPGTVVADARNSNILWINSAGNSAQRHWVGTWNDPNANAFFNFSPTDEGQTVIVDRGDDFCAFLKWDEWPVAANDFDLLLAISATGQLVAVSQTRQVGAQPPTEEFCYTNNTGAGQNFALFVQGIRVTSAPRMDIYVRNVDPPLEYLTPDSSVGDPGASPSAFTIGAVCWKDNSLEPYSGRGPTIDGRVKPDIAGQDSQSSSTYGPFSACGQSGFTGTSASAPTVAGAAALVKQLNPTFDANAIQTFLEQNAVDLGDTGKDNAYGAGALRVPTPTGQGPGRRDTLPPNAKAIASKGKRGAQIKLYSQASDDSGEVRLIDTIKRGTRTVQRLQTGFTRTRAGTTYYLLWKAPASVVPGTLAHCVQAFDRTGNKSKVSCAKLTITKK